jgi:hypothetical protein
MLHGIPPQLFLWKDYFGTDAEKDDTTTPFQRGHVQTIVDISIIGR